MLVGAFYRSPDKTDEDYLNKVKEEISTIKEKHHRDIFVIGGDFILPLATRYQRGNHKPSTEGPTIQWLHDTKGVITSVY